MISEVKPFGVIFCIIIGILLIMLFEYDFKCNYDKKIITTLRKPSINSFLKKSGKALFIKYNIKAYVSDLDCYVDLDTTYTKSYAQTISDKYSLNNKSYYIWKSGVSSKRCYLEKLPNTST